MRAPAPWQGQLETAGPSDHVVQLYTDKVPNEYYSERLRSQFGSNTARQRHDASEGNLWFQQAAFNGNEQLPLYVILEPSLDGKIAVVGIYDEGKINNEAAFAEFLRAPVRPGVASQALAQN